MSALTRQPMKAVAIGASAGGVEALLVLLRALPPDFPLPLLVVLHVAANHKGDLAGVFERQCALPVREAEDKDAIARATVYLAPPGYHMQVEPDLSLSLSLDEPVHFSRPSIDVLFESAAFAYGAGLLAIVLTGASEDGSAGLATVKRLGGCAWVQDPGQAASPLMPEAALRAVQPDRVLGLETMAACLANLR